MAGPRRTESLRHRLRGPWRLAIRQASMEPTLVEGDWLLIDPTTTRWPRVGSLVAFLEPDTGVLAVKRLAAGPGTRIPFETGFLELADDEAWLTADATPEVTAETELGPPRDSVRYGPVPVAMLVGRIWFRYGPWRRLGPIRRSSRPLGTSRVTNSAGTATPPADGP